MACVHHCVFQARSTPTCHHSDERPCCQHHLLLARCPLQQPGHVPAEAIHTAQLQQRLLLQRQTCGPGVLQPQQALMSAGHRACHYIQAICNVCSAGSCC